MHLESLSVDHRARIDSTRQITIVDDVVTKGRTLAACAIILSRAFPRHEIRAFALIRTMGRVDEIDKILDPCVGIIELREGDARREP